jgi:hypothetical protein
MADGAKGVSLYERDFYSWARAQAAAVRAKDAAALDWDNLAEELEGLSRTEARELHSRYQVLLAHLLKWLVQPERRSRSWRNTIANQREALAEHLADNPGLKSRDGTEFERAYAKARRDASTETDLDLAAFPEEPPFTPEQAKDPDFLPE